MINSNLIGFNNLSNTVAPVLGLAVSAVVDVIIVVVVVIIVISSAGPPG
ncbi:hypothetical protein [Acanthopleuribacter pedis]|uniref:Uncharacterized protein n=1 Tax=Acanthopleuribacter pedis TaxID=442870 RepID=A0A8J7U2K5_9BACT|nr:hypothetical protein [Acanthopleuribacter pedis]MBO1318692.1 hypothetical protein [Acanthopleuribacter pedis]